MQIPDDSARKRKSRAWNRIWALALLTLLILSNRIEAQWAGKDGWVEEPAAKSLNVEGDPGHAYLDPASVHRGDDGLIYSTKAPTCRDPRISARSVS